MTVDRQASRVGTSLRDVRAWRDGPVADASERRPYHAPVRRDAACCTREAIPTAGGCSKLRPYLVLLALVASTCLPAQSASNLTPEQARAEAFLFTPAGFEREGKPVWHPAASANAGRVQIVVRDAATGAPTPCRINVVGPDGNYYQPEQNRLSPFALTGAWPAPGNSGNRIGKAPYRYYGRFFYTTGETTVSVPPGPVRIEVWKGFEYKPAVVSARAQPGEATRVQVSLEQTTPMDAAGYYVGDAHLHFLRQTEAHDEIMFDLLEAEGLRYGCTLAYNHPPGPYAGFMEKLDYPQRLPIGARSIRTRGNVHIISGQEYRSGTYGHMNLYLLDEIVFPGANFNADHWPVYGDVARDARARGGFAMMAHGGYAQEVWADAALGTIHAVELLQFGVYRGIELQGWYDMLNTGYRFPAAAACDYPPCRTLADCRTYVHHDSAPTMRDWIAGLHAGRSFFTTGPLLLLDVDGRKPGEQLRQSGPGPHTVRARVRVRCEVTPVTQVDLIVNGRIVEQRTVPRGEGQGRWIEFEHALELKESAWVAARAHSQAPIGQPDAEAHTNPVYVYVNDRAPYQRAALDAWVAKIDGEIARHSQRRFAELPKVLAYFQRARDVLLKIREQGGLSADADPARLAVDAGELKPGAQQLARDGSDSGPGEAELKEFLKPLPTVPPRQALAMFDTVDGFQMELMAAEPMVASPVAAAFDEDGNLYVAEMRDYPYNLDQPVRVAVPKRDPDASTKPLGSIRLLRDRDGDGRFDDSTVFADGLLWAAGVQPWQGGVFVTAPPNIWYLKDTDGDGRADVREIVFTGFGAQNQQAMVNSLQFGLDHRIYASTGGNGGVIRRGGDAASPGVSVQNRDVSFDPVARTLEAVTGGKQFGVAFDDWGNRFLCSQADPAFHVVLEQRYLDRNPHFAPPAAMFRTTPQPTPIFRTSPVERWRHIRSNRRIAAGTRAADSEGVSHHVFDAGAGVTIYRGGAYPKEYYGSLLTPDGQNNLVHRRRLVAQGATFRTERADANAEFVRSSDIWFRPVNLLNAPDGTLWCLDMSREYLETINIPADVERHLDLTSGRNQGRIYRIAPAGFKPPPGPRLGRATTAELVAALQSPHGWWRDTAHRLIFERQDRAAIPLLRNLAKTGAPEARVHALWSLAGLKSLEDALILDALADTHAGVRGNAVRLAEPRLEGSAELRAKIATLVDDPEPRVRLQVALAVGESARFAQAALLARLLGDRSNDPWIQAAALSSAGRCGIEVFGLLARDASGSSALPLLATMVGAQNQPAAVGRAIEAIAQWKDPAAALPLATALAEGLRRGGATLAARDTQGRLQPVLRLATVRALDANQPDSARRAAIEALALLPYAEAVPSLRTLLHAKLPAGLQGAALSALTQFREPAVGTELIAAHAALAPATKARALAAVLERPERLEALWTALENRTLQPADLTSAQANLLRQHRDARVRAQAVRWLGVSRAPAKDDVYRSLVPALQRAGVADRGKAIFEGRCAACHQHGGIGSEFGPTLAAAGSGGREKLLSSIVDPNREVLPQYVAYAIETKEGEHLLGFLESESSASVTLRQAGGIRKTLARSSILKLASQEQSLMPEGLESGLTPQEVADLIEFIVNPGT